MAAPRPIRNREKLPQLVLRGQPHLSEPQRGTNFVKIHQLAGWNDNHLICAIAEDDNRLGNLPWGQVFRRGNLARREGRGMSGEGILRVVGIEETTQSLWRKGSRIKVVDQQPELFEQLA